MYILYWSPGSASMAPHVLLEELGVPYELRRVDLKKPREQSYLKLQPWGRVPTLIADRAPIYESAAICMHLADRHAERGLAPAPATAERGLYYQWLLFLADTLQPTFRRVYRPSSFIDDPEQQEGIKQQGLRDVAEIWARLDGLLGEKTYLAGDRFTAADIYFHMLYTWDADMEALGRRHPNLAALFQRIHARPAVARIAELNM